MLVNVLINLGYAEFAEDALTEGVHEVSETTASRLIRRGLAVACDESPITIQAVAEHDTAITNSQPVTIKKPEPEATPLPAKTNSQK